MLIYGCLSSPRCPWNLRLLATAALAPRAAPESRRCAGSCWCAACWASSRTGGEKSWLHHEENYCIFMYICIYIYICMCMCICIRIRICIMYMYNVYVYVYVYIHHGYVDGMKTMSINRNQLFWCKQKGTRVLNGSGRNLSYGVSILLNTVPPFFKRLRWQ